MYSSSSSDGGSARRGRQPPRLTIDRERYNRSSGSQSRSTPTNPFSDRSHGSGHAQLTISSSTKTNETSIETLRSIRSDVMVSYLYQQALSKSYLTPLDLWQGIVLKKGRGEYAFCPPQLEDFENGLLDNVRNMNVCCAMTVSTPVTRTVLESMAYVDLDYVPMPNGLRVQVLKTMSDLPRCQLHHFAAFLEDLMILVVWDDDAENLLKRAEDLEAKFVEMIWGEDTGDNEADEAGQEEEAQRDGGDINVEPRQLEAGITTEERRPVRLENAVIVALTLCLTIICISLGWKALAIECMVDGTYIRLVLVAFGPMQLFISLFFFQAICGNIIQLVGPVSQMISNSKNFSGRAPKKQLERRRVLPHVTIQMPVSKEGLAGVIRPTVMSVKAAISTYEMQGGTANIFVNDDGMQLVSEADAQARREFYDEHQIGWVARPMHNPYGDKPFYRRGKFKKASNMNYAMGVSNRVEAKLRGVQRTESWTQVDEGRAYEEALATVLAEDEGRARAGGNIRMGDYILLVDCDTRVPKDCLLDGVTEMEESPHVAIIQYKSGVMNVSKSYFEKGVTWFTHLIYTAITFAVSTGDACPFVGHNALMRWSAIQSAAAFDDGDGYEKYWSESHVSEDFDMAIRLQCAGYTLRYAAYTGEGFKEGVSLTVYDEVARWEKYAYGCNELIFHPFRYWLVRGPFTPLFRKFITTSAMPLPAKITICSYIGTYYAIASAWVFTAVNYFVTGWGYGMNEKYYAESFSTFFSVVMVFTGVGNFSLAVLRYRLERGNPARKYWENLKWIPMFSVFLGGISLHVSQAILSHFFEIEMNWGATAKEVEAVVFHEEIVRILKKFTGTFVFCLLGAVMMVMLFWFVPYQWQVRDFASIFPFAMLVGCHFWLPVVLNPALMKLSW
ncbi:Glucans biosynthesis glucosyltransferase H [Cytospora mali]|uniref:Glucans biosynthesis glucosyltransferase H n=1 Tax=Cytospora mali TaxID=578113 RepID=A0A194VFV3_CYTMA|nr:Glucans biosynthesis glucosyltransferase H [Valsa mali var. pyri (nom. inval.)]